VTSRAPTDPTGEGSAAPAVPTELQELRDRIRALEARLAAVAPVASTTSVEHTSSRRGLLRLAGAATLGALGATVAGKGSAAADIGLASTLTPSTFSEPVRATYTGTSPSMSGFVFQSSTANGNGSTFPAALAGFADDQPGPSNGVYGYTTDPDGRGVVGYNPLVTSGTGVQGSGFVGVIGNSITLGGGAGMRARKSGSAGAAIEATADGTDTAGLEAVATAVAVYGRSSGNYGGQFGVSTAAGPAALQLFEFVARSAPPSRADFHADGELDIAGKALWYCYESGIPGKWRKLAGPGTAGAFHPISPKRVYDSRLPVPAPGVLAAGATRDVSVADARDLATGAVKVANIVPAFASAITCNITVVDTVGGGYVTANPGGVTTVDAASINWSATGQVLNNGTVVTLDAQRRVTLICGGGPGTQTNVVIDVTGYFL
jgi:hypothetical protein